jgi:hypothetical protein
VFAAAVAAAGVTTGAVDTAVGVPTTTAAAKAAVLAVISVWSAVSLAGSTPAAAIRAGMPFRSATALSITVSSAATAACRSSMADNSYWFTLIHFLHCYLLATVPDSTIVNAEPFYAKERLLSCLQENVFCIRF